ncbi:MAG: hypothetical protein E7559_04940 [Ruminococcaceae bacterium]|nr:hypothetical protein [Oscillospiraceae bacterium]
MDHAFIIGFAAAIVAAIVFYSVYARRKGISEGKEFDERQLIVRGKSFKASYITLAVLLIAYLLAGSSFGYTGILDPFYGVILSLLFSVFPMIAVRIFNDSYFGRGDHSKRNLITIGLLSLFNLGTGLYRIISTGEPFKTGEMNVSLVSLVVGVMGIAVIAMVLIRNLMLKKAEESEDDE